MIDALMIDRAGSYLRTNPYKESLQVHVYIYVHAIKIGHDMDDKV
jgi:hypothetical protein